MSSSSASILRNCPLPLARAYQRSIHSKDRDHRFNAALKGLASPTLGEWMEFLRGGLVYFAQRAPEPDPLLKAFHSVVFEKVKGRKDLIELHNQLRSAPDGRPGAAESTTVRDVLERCVAYRNRVLGHGAPVSKEHYEAMGLSFEKGFEDLVEHSTFLEALRLMVVEEGRMLPDGSGEYSWLDLTGPLPVRA